MVNKKLNERFLRSKKAQGHVEIILSFIIFIGFLLFIFIFMNPFSRTKETSYIMDNIEKSIINEISGDVGKLSVIGNTGLNPYIVPVAHGNKFIEVPETTSNPIKCNLYFSDEITTWVGTQTCTFDTYQLGTYSTEKMIMEQKISSLVIEYGDGYNDLKTSLGITNDFLFEIRNLVRVKDEALSVEYSKNIPTGIDIEAREIPIRVIDSTGQIKELILYIRAW